MGAASQGNAEVFFEACQVEVYSLTFPSNKERQNGPKSRLRGEEYSSEERQRDQTARKTSVKVASNEALINALSQKQQLAFNISSYHILSLKLLFEFPLSRFLQMVLFSHQEIAHITSLILNFQRLC